MTDEEGYGEEGYTVVGTERYTAAEGHGGLSVALFFLLGAVAGAGLGLLLTPQSGRKTRRQIKEASRETKAVLGGYSARILNKVEATLDKGREVIREGKPLLLAAIEAGKEAYEREKEQRTESGK
jgi:gas vesicle protein